MAPSSVRFDTFVVKEDKGKWYFDVFCCISHDKYKSNVTMVCINQMFKAMASIIKCLGHGMYKSNVRPWQV